MRSVREARHAAITLFGYRCFIHCSCSLFGGSAREKSLQRPSGASRQVASLEVSSLEVLSSATSFEIAYAFGDAFCGARCRTQHREQRDSTQSKAACGHRRHADCRGDARGASKPVRRTARAVSRLPARHGPRQASAKSLIFRGTFARCSAKACDSPVSTGNGSLHSARHSVQDRLAARAIISERLQDSVQAQPR